MFEPAPPRLILEDRLYFHDPLQVALDALEGYMELGMPKDAMRMWLGIQSKQWSDFRTLGEGRGYWFVAFQDWQADVLERYRTGAITKAEAIAEMGLPVPA